MFTLGLKETCGHLCIPELSVFPNKHGPSKPLKDLRRSWARALKDAGLRYFWLYDLRHTLASRLTQAGARDRSPLPLTHRLVSAAWSIAFSSSRTAHGSPASTPT
jgi:integrase